MDFIHPQSRTTDDLSGHLADFSLGDTSLFAPSVEDVMRDLSDPQYISSTAQPHPQSLSAAPYRYLIQCF